MNFEQHIKEFINREVSDPLLNEVLLYSLLPAGKLFRPTLYFKILQDKKIVINQKQIHEALALELHHAYTLIHDDMPCMDNDLVRRNKPTTHVQFGQWQALLAGDALLILSFKALAKYSPDKLPFFSWATGSKGLILGQKMDLALENHTFESTMRLHELKTSRLIQSAIYFALHDAKNALYLGSHLGLAFQLMDDRDDLKSENEHEREMNPWHKYSHECEKQLQKSQSKVLNYLTQHNLNETRQYIENFFQK